MQDLSQLDTLRFQIFSQCWTKVSHTEYMYSGHAEETKKREKNLLNSETVSLSVALHCIAILEQLEQMSQAEYCLLAST